MGALTPVLGKGIWHTDN